MYTILLCKNICRQAQAYPVLYVCAFWLVYVYIYYIARRTVRQSYELVARAMQATTSSWWLADQNQHWTVWKFIRPV
jgi:hypothetical protein